MTYMRDKQLVDGIGVYLSGEESQTLIVSLMEGSIAIQSLRTSLLVKDTPFIQFKERESIDVGVVTSDGEVSIPQPAIRRNNINPELLTAFKQAFAEYAIMA